MGFILEKSFMSCCRKTPFKTSPRLVTHCMSVLRAPGHEAGSSCFYPTQPII